MKKIYLVTENVSAPYYEGEFDAYPRMRSSEKAIIITDNYDLAKNCVDRANKVLKDKEFIDWVDKMSYEELKERNIEYLEWRNSYRMCASIDYSITEIELDDEIEYSEMLELMLKDYEKFENKETGE